MGEYRLLRLGEQIRGEIANMMLRGEIKDPRVNSTNAELPLSTLLTINRVEVVSDLAYAKVFVSGYLPEDALNKGVKGLQSAAGFIQSSIAKKLRIRKFPKLTFVADTSLRDGFNMVQRLNEIEAQDAEIAKNKPAESEDSEK